MAAPIKFARGAGKPVNLDMRFMDNIASGALLQFGSISIGQFASEVVRWGNATGMLSRSMFYFVGEGENAGTGRFSQGLASHVRDWVQQAILFPSARKKNVAAGFHGPPRSGDYQLWLDKIGKGDQNTFYFEGTVAAAFDVIKSTAGGVTLGIRPSVRAPAPVPYSVPLEFQTGKWSSVGGYALRVEYGGAGFPKRPIITGAIVGWLEKAQPAWAQLLRNFMYDTYKVGKDQYKALQLPNPLDMQRGKQADHIVRLMESWGTDYTHNVIATVTETVAQFDNWAEKHREFFAGGGTLPPAALKLLRNRFHLNAQRLGQLNLEFVEKLWRDMIWGRELETILPGIQGEIG